MQALKPLSFNKAVEMGLDPEKGFTEAVEVVGFQARLMADGKIHRYCRVKTISFVQPGENRSHEHLAAERTVPFESVTFLFKEEAPETLHIT